MKKQTKILVAYIILGFGIGVIFTSSLTILYPTVKFKDYTDEEIKQKARALGMIEFDKESIELEDTRNSKKKVEKSSEENAVVVQFEIKKGETSQEIIDTLLNKGLIRDKEDFSKLIKQKGLETKFNYGNYRVPKDINVEELLQRVTNK